jgi:hypothetical protein
MVLLFFQDGAKPNKPIKIPVSCIHAIGILEPNSSQWVLITTCIDWPSATEYLPFVVGLEKKAQETSERGFC